MLTHGNIWWNNTNSMLTFGAQGSDIVLVVAPLFHIGGLNVNTLLTWQTGGHIVLHRAFDPARFFARSPGPVCKSEEFRAQMDRTQAFGV